MRHTWTSCIIGGLTLVLVVGFGASHTVQAGSVFINEIHYDNSGADTGESIEIGGPAGTALTGWSLILYNGNDGLSYGSLDLNGQVIPDQQNGFGTLSLLHSGIQNGAPDGLALVDAGNAVVQFLSYEGSFTALGGPADGHTSMSIGVSETSSTAVGFSLQLVGTGTVAEDFTWAGPIAQTFGSVNAGQTFESVIPTPEPGTFLLLGSNLFGLALYGCWRRRTQKV